MRKSQIEGSRLTESPLRSSQLGQSGYREFTIETNDKEIPFISIYRPDHSMQLRRAQAVINIDHNLKKYETKRAAAAFTKLFGLIHKEKGGLLKAKVVASIFVRLVRKRLITAIWQMQMNRIKVGKLPLGGSIVRFIENAVREKQKRWAINCLLRNKMGSEINLLSNEQELAREL